MKKKTRHQYRIWDISELKKLALNNDFECFIVLNGGLRSSKVIRYNPKKKKCWYIWNLIDDSQQDLTLEQLRKPSYTNVGKALKLGALWYEKERDVRYCHLCGSEEIKGGWCTNKSCSEYTRYKK